MVRAAKKAGLFGAGPVCREIGILKILAFGGFNEYKPEFFVFADLFPVDRFLVVGNVDSLDGILIRKKIVRPQISEKDKKNNRISCRKLI